MLLDLNTIETIGQADLEDLQSKLLYRKFGQENDSIELTIRDINGNVVINDEQFTDYTAYYNGGDQGNLVDSIDVDYIQVLKDYGFENGKYKLTFSFQRKLLVNTFERPFYISEISPSRTEIRFASSILAEDTFNNALQNLIANVNNASFVKDVNISFSSGETGLVVNTQIDTDSGLIKLYDPLTVNISVNSSFRIYEEIINPLEATIDLGPSTSEDTGVELRAPNFDIQFSQEYTVPSKFRTYDDILNQGAVTSSFQNIQNYFSGSIPIDLEFDNPNTPSGYTFENFIHFSSATERLKNFKYKLELLESYSGSLATLSNITGSISESSPTTQNISIFRNKRDKLIGGFDYYERYLYYESGTYAWPKINIGKPYTNAKVNSAAATSWFGAPIDDDQNEFYGGQMLSASKFDSCNPYNLINTIPPDIQNNSQNEGYILFTEMIAQHFDGIWAYIDSITDKPQAYSGLNDGISKELVFNALAEKGIRGYSQFENSSIYEYLIGDDGSGTFQYQSPDTFSTMVSASNAGSIPKGDISKEIWKRLYHNTPYLLKTKGTERGLKALIACYGIPETVLHVKEYGGPLQDKTGFRTFSYQKESKMLSSIDVNSADHPMLSLNEFGTGFLPNTKTIQVRFLPTKGTNTTYDIITLIDPDPDIAGVTGGVHDIAIGISQSIDTSKVNSGSFAHLVIASGSSDDNGINFGITGKASSNLGPIFNGEVWNLSVRLNSGSDEGNTIEAFATNTTPNKNTYVLSCSLDATEFFRIPNPGLADLDETEVMVGNTRNVSRKPLLGGFTGSIQEYRGWTEKLTEATIVTQSLSPFNYNGNTISSSFEALYIRIPLGSTLTLNSQQATENHAPNSAFHIYKGFQYAFNSNPTFIEETHHLPTPDTVGSGMVSDKVRIDNGTFDDNFLDPFISVETSPQDRQPLDFSDVGVFFSPTFEVNEDIIYTLGGFRLDDYIGDPTYYTSASYPALKDLKDIYTQKLDKKLGIGDYIRTIQFFDHTLFKMIKDFVPAKANLKTGLVIEPHYLERVKVPGKNVDYEQKPEHLFHVQSSASLVGSENINETNIVIDVEEYLTQGTEGTATENVAQVGKKSKFYILR